MLDTLVSLHVFEAIIFIIGTIVLIVEYVKIFKKKSCLWLLHRADKAKQEGRITTATLEDFRRRFTDGANKDYIIARYRYNMNGRTKQKVFHFAGSEAPPEQLKLYYNKYTNRVKTYEQFTHSRIRRFWPWIKMAIVCAPIMWLFNILHLVNY